MAGLLIYESDPERIDQTLSLERRRLLTILGPKDCRL